MSSADPRSRKGDVLLIVPPFSTLDRPSLAAHLLQACAREAGFEVDVLYANILLAGRMGEGRYNAICYAPFYALAGERFFAAAAYGGEPLGRHTEQMFSPDVLVGSSRSISLGRDPTFPLTLDEIRALETLAAPFADDVAQAVVGAGYRVVGCTSTFEQTAASIAILNRIKALRPGTVTVIGGANCEGEMAKGILSLGAKIDYVFSGESERSFPRFLREIAEGHPPAERIIPGQRLDEMDSVPRPRFNEYYAQLAEHLPKSDAAREMWLPYESSRGCWWGEVKHCTFCGLNGLGMAFREKSPERVIADLRALLAEHPQRQVFMVDNIMPHTFFKTLVPRLGRELPGVHVFYEQKSNLTLDNVLALKEAGVHEIQPGIESLSTSLLRRMSKGVQAYRNIALLRYARAADVAPHWNILWGFPGEGAEEHEEVINLLPLMRHLHPPRGVSHLSIDRFSPYFDKPAEHGIRSLHPLPSYGWVLPEGADVERVAYHFWGDYESGLYQRPELLWRLYAETGKWIEAWRAPPGQRPMLHVAPVFGEWFQLTDTRGLSGSPVNRLITREQAMAALVEAPLDDAPATRWAHAERVAIPCDARSVPLATASPELLRQLEAERRRRRGERAAASHRAEEIRR